MIVSDLTKVLKYIFLNFRLEVIHEANSTAAVLKISPVRAEDEGVFRCELTYLLVGEDCDTVQLLHFRTLSKHLFLFFRCIFSSVKKMNVYPI